MMKKICLTFSLFVFTGFSFADDLFSTAPVPKERSAEQREVKPENQIIYPDKLKQEKKDEELLNEYERTKIKTTTELLKEPPIPVKMPDTIVRVLILPYIDSRGDYNSYKYVFVKVKEGDWVLGNYVTTKEEIKREYNPLIEVKEEKSNKENKK